MYTKIYQYIQERTDIIYGQFIGRRMEDHESALGE